MPNSSNGHYWRAAVQTQYVYIAELHRVWGSVQEVLPHMLVLTLPGPLSILCSACMLVLDFCKHEDSLSSITKSQTNCCPSLTSGHRNALAYLPRPSQRLAQETYLNTNLKVSHSWSKIPWGGGDFDDSKKRRHEWATGLMPLAHDFSSPRPPFFQTFPKCWTWKRWASIMGLLNSFNQGSSIPVFTFPLPQIPDKMKANPLLTPLWVGIKKAPFCMCVWRGREISKIVKLATWFFWFYLWGLSLTFSGHLNICSSKVRIKFWKNQSSPGVKQITQKNHFFINASNCECICLCHMKVTKSLHISKQTSKPPLVQS